MTIDIGSGINTSEMFGDIWSTAQHPAPVKNEPPTHKKQFKATYLEMQKAILDKDIAVFQSGLKSIGDQLTQKQTNTLGREILREFDPRFAAALSNCQWEELVTADSLILCANRNNHEGFLFCLNVLVDLGSKPDAMTQHYFRNELRESFARLTNLSEKNHEAYNALRPHLLPYIQSLSKDYKDLALRDVMQNIWGTTPETVVWYQHVMDDLTRLDVEWDTVFFTCHPLNVLEEKDLFGPTAFFQRHPHILEKFTTWSAAQQKKYEDFCQFCQTEIFAVSLDTVAPVPNLFSEEFKKEIGPKLGYWLHKATTPNHILEEFKNPYYSFNGDLKHALMRFADAHNVDPNFKHIVASEQLFYHDPNFIHSVLKTTNGLKNIQQYTHNPIHLEVLAQMIAESPPTQQKQLFAALSGITDKLGNTLSHVLMHDLSKADLSIRANQNLLLLCMKNSWDTPNAAGQTPKQMFEPSPEMEEVSREIFKTHLKQNLSQHLKHEHVKPSKSTQRKM